MAHSPNKVHEQHFEFRSTWENDRATDFEGEHIHIQAFRHSDIGQDLNHPGPTAIDWIIVQHRIFVGMFVVTLLVL